MEKVSTNFVANFSTEQIPQSVIDLWRNWIFYHPSSPILKHSEKKDLVTVRIKKTNLQGDNNENDHK